MEDERQNSGLDLSLESAERLEATKERFGSQWRRHGLKKLLVAGAVFVAMVIIGVIAHALGAFEKTWNPVSGVMSLLLFGALVVAVGVWLGQVISGLRTIICKPPLAGTSAEETIRKYMEAPIIRLLTLTGKIGTPAWLQSYICLLDQTKSRVGEYNGFVTHWENIAKEIKNQLNEHYKPRSITNMTCQIDRIECITEFGGGATYKVGIKIDATEGINSPGVSRPKPIGSANLISTIEVAHVGKRWYLTSPYWSGKVE
jgi:hypothetical protein